MSMEILLPFESIFDAFGYGEGFVKIIKIAGSAGTVVVVVVVVDVVVVVVDVVVVVVLVVVVVASQSQFSQGQPSGQPSIHGQFMRADS